MTFAKGSFEWYQTIDDKFMKNLCGSVMRADINNRRKLSKIFPHIVSANLECSWLSPPDTDYPITINVNRLIDDPKMPESCNFKHGSFNRYLFMSGHFVTFMSRVVFYADPHNIELIKLQYPQMVAAFQLENWEEAPPGFKNQVYNG